MKHGFYQLDAEWLELIGKNGIDYRHIVLLSVINTLSKKQGYCYASNSTLCKILNISNSTLKRWMRILEDNNLIEREIDAHSMGIASPKRGIKLGSFLSKSSAHN